MGYGLDGRGSRQGKQIFSTPQHLDQLWGPPSLLSNGYHGMYSRGKSSGDVKLTTHLHLVPRSRMVELYLHSPICLHGIVRKYILKYRDNFDCSVFGRPRIIKCPALSEGLLYCPGKRLKRRKYQPGQPVSGPRFEHRSSRIGCRITTSNLTYHHSAAKVS
jgi:hypothetical protein